MSTVSTAPIVFTVSTVFTIFIVSTLPNTEVADRYPADSPWCSYLIHSRPLGHNLRSVGTEFQDMLHEGALGDADATPHYYSNYVRFFEAVFEAATIYSPPLYAVSL